MNQSESKVIYCGIDISKSTFDVYYQGNSHVFNNSIDGFKNLENILKEEVHCVMEATGPYYLKLAAYLYSHQIKVSVINPLVIKRFSQMRMIKAKTDKADAKLIALYAEKEAPKLWKAPKAVLLKIQQEQTVLEGLMKQVRVLRNQLEAISVQPSQSREALKTVKLILGKVEEQIEVIEASIIMKVEKHFHKELELIISIPGIGIKTAIALLVTTDGFSRFDSSKQVASYVGLYEGKETIVWKGQSSLVDPSSIESAAKSFTKKMVNHMVQSEVVQPK